MSWARKVWWENLDEQTVSSRTKENIEISRSVFGFYERKMLHLLWDEEECESNETLSYRVEVTDDVYDKYFRNKNSNKLNRIKYCSTLAKINC